MIPGWKFLQPQWLWLLTAIPVLLAVHFLYLRKRQPTLRYSSLLGFAQAPRSWKTRMKDAPVVLRSLALSALIVALARPQSSSSSQNITTEGIDIVMALDISASMLAEDLKPNRIEAAKKVARDFIDQRPNDRIGLVVFSGESFTQCPMTTDHAVLKNLLLNIQSGMLLDGTALGEGLATAVNRIRNSSAKSKVIILLTDGVNNIGAIAPETAGDIAQAFGIRVYTIGVGTEGMAPYPVQTPLGTQYQYMPVQIDEAVLKNIASATGGKYFRATSTGELKTIYQDIDKLEKTRIDVTEFRHRAEEFYPFALVALVLLCLEFFLRQTIFRTLP
jgi:Ca-activated chloride channel family protein